MSRRLDQLPRDLGDFGRELALLRREVDELRARQSNLSAADGMLPPLNSDQATWPQTMSASYVTISSSSHVAKGPQLRLTLTTAVGSGTTGNIRVMINGVQWGPTTAAGTPFDYTGPHGIASGAEYTLAVEAQRTGGANSVAAQVRLIRAIY
ncbi:hypothetical protein [Streptomyces virginiae]|uniref:hypothetical protein n=1 Tax=Streptomyces virginiae TaxID=1961 RepID=UPI00225BDCE9|nr:hypothetical protein [Streptomyces virginiae]MCX5176704.1 hypothetical protein [Streptomyces virginiae]